MFKLVNGDCIEVMKSLPDNSVDAVVTDPPYGMRFMGKEWDTFRQDKRGKNQLINMGNGMKPLDHYELLEFQSWNVLWAIEVLRVLKPGGHLLSFGGTRTYHRMACAIEDAGFEIRDQLQWIYGSGFPKSMNIGNGWGTALKPANEPIVLARKPIEEKTVASNVLKWGTGGINIDGCRVGTEELSYTSTFKRMIKNNIEQGYRPKTMEGSGGDIERSVTGRFPANVIMDDEAGEILDKQSGKAGACARASGPTAGKLGRNGIYSGAIGEDWEDGNKSVFYADKGGASRFFYCAKASRSERNAGLKGMESKDRIDYGGFHSEQGLINNNRNPENRLPMQNHHPTVKPIALMRYLCRLITPPGGTVLDPFMGSGTTGIAAEQEGFNFYGIERDADYIEIAEKRIHDAVMKHQPSLLEKERANAN